MKPETDMVKLIGKYLEEYKIPRCEAETPCTRQNCLEKPNFHRMSAHADINHS